MQSSDFYMHVLDEMSSSFLYGRIVRGTDRSIDIEILETNRVFSVFASCEGADLTGRSIRDLLPGQDGFWARIAELPDPVYEGYRQNFEFRTESLSRWYKGSVFAPRAEHLVFLMDDITAHKRSAESMMENLSNVTSIINTIPNPVFYKDTEFKYVFFNRAFEEFVGFKKEDIVGKKSSQIASADLALTYDESDWIVAETKKFYTHESKVEHSDGTRHDVVFYKSPLLTRYGALRGIVGVILDITDRKRIEASLDKFKYAVEQSPTSIVMTDTRGNIEYVNPKFTSLTGYSFDEVKGQNPRILKSGLMSHEYYESMWQMISSGKEWHGEFHNKKKDGSLYWESASVSGIKNSRNEIVSFIAIKEDITDRKKMESALRDSEELMSVLLDAMQDPATLLSLQGEIIALNEPAAERFHVVKSSCVGRNVFDLLSNPAKENRKIAFRNVLEYGKPYQWEDLDDGRFYDSISYPVKGLDGTVACVAVYSRDITAHKKNESVLRDLVEKAERANREKSNFLATMSHEIRTPLNAIIGMTDLTLMTDSDIEKLDYLHTVKDSAIHLLSVINDVLDFSKMESGKFTLKQDIFDLHKVAESVIMLLRGDALSRGLELKLTVQEGLPAALSGDGAAFKQILINLMGNAVKFTEQGGVYVDISFRLEDDRAVVTTHVTDTGIGIPPERMGIIFESFTRANSYTGSKYGGSGLGLSICRNLTKLMKGEISATSVPGKGSEFTLEIPFVVAESRTARTSSSQSAARMKKLTVLVAEDNLVNVKFMTIVLGKLGYEYDVAGNGIDALRWCSKRTYDVILMDIEMPEMDGIEATQTLRADPSSLNCTTPVIALTAHAVADVQDRCLAAGMNGFITKPIRIEEIEKKISDVLFPSPPLN
jgi:PAS domain S-box-containing protein